MIDLKLNMTPLETTKMERSKIAVINLTSDSDNSVESHSIIGLNAKKKEQEAIPEKQVQ